MRISDCGRVRATAFAATIAMAAWLTPSHARGEKTYWIGEHTDFTGNGCPTLSDLNTVTASLKTELDNAGWTGQRWTNGNSWPQDYMESTFPGGGIDNVAGDNAAFTVYAGHGANAGDFLLFGTPFNGLCSVRMSTQARLGTLGGNKATVAAYLTSCTMSLVGGNWNLLSNNEVIQQLGFDDSPSIPDDSAADFFGCTGVNTNHSCWLTYMEDELGWFTGDNSPIVFTYAYDPITCASNQNR